MKRCILPIGHALNHLYVETTDDISAWWPCNKAEPKPTVIFDSGDIDSNNNWQGELVGCLECRETTPIRLSLTPTYLMEELQCGECGSPLGDVWV